MKVILSILLSFTLLATGLPMPGQATASSSEALFAEGQEQGEDNAGIPDETQETAKDENEWKKNPGAGEGDSGSAEERNEGENNPEVQEGESMPSEERNKAEESSKSQEEGKEPAEEAHNPEENGEGTEKQGKEEQKNNKLKSGETKDKEKGAGKTADVPGLKRQEKRDGLTLAENQRYASPNEYYQNTSGYFFVYVRKEGDGIENGEWYQLNMSVKELSANESQKINWKLKRIGTMPLKEKDHVMTWIVSASEREPVVPDKFGLKLETGKKWEKTGHDSFGTNPVLGFWDNLTQEQISNGFPSPNRHYMMCGKILYTLEGYRMYFDASVFGSMKDLDIVPENKQIQKKDKDLAAGEEPWTGDDYFKFAIDTNNVGMTNYSADGKFHHSMYGFRLKPNKYKVAYNANGGSGTVSGQNATYDKELTLKEGTKLSREGYTLTGWNTKKDGSGKAYGLGEKTKNLTGKNNATVTLYAQWKPNTLKITYHANGGQAKHGAEKDIATFMHNWNYKTTKQKPVTFQSFGLSRMGYTPKDGAEWNTKADGTGRSYAQGKEYKMTDYAPNIKTGSREITLYAQWKPNIYTITLSHGLKNPEQTGTGKLYTKSIGGIFSDSGCTTELAAKKGRIAIPKKTGYKFKGYYSGISGIGSGRKQMIDASGILTGEKSNDVSGNQTWYAAYDYLIGCEDYADIPCDMEKVAGDPREDPGVRLTYNSSTGKVTAETSQPGISVTLTGQPSGTEVGEFTSTTAVSSAAGNTGSAQNTELSIPILEGAAYSLEAKKGDKIICSRLVYYKDGRFRTLVKLGTQKEKEAASGSSLAGSAWNADAKASYDLYEYHGCSELKNIKAPGTVCRYFRYKDVNMAYSGSGATEGRNTLEYDVSLEDMYQFRDNGFTKEKTETKQTEDEEAYECEVTYSFQGWEMKLSSFAEKDQYPETEVYKRAENEGAISDHTTEDISTYQEAEPIRVMPGFGTMSLAGTERGAQAWEAYAAVSGKAHAEEYINLKAKWDACPTIVVTPGEKMEFYEGEEVTKEKLISHLTAHDNEDNIKMDINPDLNDRLRILKVVYPEPENHSQAAYEKTYETDVPEGFLLDTYYLKLTEDEEVDVLVTFAVTDSAGNTTEEEIPVKVKYNHYPEISSEDVFYYLKEEANRGEITEEALLGRASAEDTEDGNITGKLGLKDFDAQVIKMQTKSKEEFSITYQVTDAYKKTTYKTVTVMVWDEDAAIAEMPKYYVRYISEKYLDTLEENSTWREPENMAYLESILRNETPIETWNFTHEDVLAVQDWITEGGDGNWKIGQAANREFLTKFAHCRQ